MSTQSNDEDASMSTPSNDEDDGPLFPDWILSNGNTHVCKDRKAFTAYLPLESYYLSANLNSYPVIGFGTVSVPVKIRQGGGPTTHGTLELFDVLHAPSSRCNLLARAKLESCDIEITEKTEKKIPVAILLGENGKRRLGYCEKKETHGMYVLKVSGPPRGPVWGPYSIKEKDPELLDGAFIPTAEEQKWKQELKDAIVEKQTEANHLVQEQIIAKMAAVQAAAAADKAINAAEEATALVDQLAAAAQQAVTELAELKAIAEDVEA
ncbi:hypothetical protein QBC35DRAFT_550625 [Podospora australis]|uniref:Retrovirus-related Pol polyprotein from transposon TNT 1-94-like beta-barrel domain-containing protein n=1 Tax=Podospora australis TaxID=1536484 RepID=A0AAN6WXR6_9PEZI|nr:hypothetical protein QBC35DRAFT_550625 [Podospora australis]